MNIRWVSYNSLGRNLQSDMEKIMLYDSPSQGVCLTDIFRYIADIAFIYSNIYARRILQSADKADADRVFVEIYRENDEYLAILKNAFAEKNYISIKETEELLRKFQVPKIDY